MISILQEIHDNVDAIFQSVDYKEGYKIGLKVAINEIKVLKELIINMQQNDHQNFDEMWLKGRSDTLQSLLELIDA